MPRFLLLLSPTRGGGGGSAAALERRLCQFGDWVARSRHEGVIRAGAPLEPCWARICREDGVTSVVERDAAASDALASYFVIEAEDWGAALAIAASCPGADPGTVTVFQLGAAGLLGEAAADAAVLR